MQNSASVYWLRAELSSFLYTILTEELVVIVQTQQLICTADKQAKSNQYIKFKQLTIHGFDFVAEQSSHAWHII
jgi:hypothetical protein